MKNYQITIRGLENPSIFIDSWSKNYTYLLEHKYNSNIGKGLDNRDSFYQLFQWKNGTGEKISAKKTKTVMRFVEKWEYLRMLREDFDWGLYEEIFEPTKNSTIWKIFLLHIINPVEFPIFDQHVYRSYKFLTIGEFLELPTSSKSVYHNYKEEYRPWFNQIQMTFKLNTKRMDEALFTYGQFLKKIEKLPIEVNLIETHI